MEYLRALARQKEETLNRARGMYVEREAELDQLRQSEEGLRAKLEAASAELSQFRDLPKRMENLSLDLESERARATRSEERARELEAELSAIDEDRRDLASALASVEAELPQLKSRLQEELKARAELAEELVGAKEALAMAQDRVGELAAARSELEGNLEAIHEQYQKLERIELELPTVVAERDAAVVERDVLRSDVDAAHARVAEQDAELADLRGQLEAFETGEAQSRSESEEQLAAARGEVEALQNECSRLREQADGLSSEREKYIIKLTMLEKALESQRARAAAPQAPPAELIEERDKLKLDVLALKRKLVVAESAMETVAMLKSKVAKLEAALKGKT